MDKLLFKKGELSSFLNRVQSQLNISSETIALKIGISGRTFRDWKREKFKPNRELIIKLSELSGIAIPEHEILSKYWYISKAAKLGGKRRYELYGSLGTKKDKSKGGRNSWFKRKSDPNLWAKYTKGIVKPTESEDLAEFMGIMLGDGGLTKFQCVIYLNSETDQEFAEYVKKLTFKLFRVVSKIYVHKKHKVWRVSVSSVNLVEYLITKGLSLGNKVHLQVGVPDWINSNQDYIKACIRGLVDTDGCFTIHKYKVNGKEYRYPKICFTNHSEPLLEFVFLGLKKFGFNPKRTFEGEVWLHNHKEVRRYLEIVGTRNYRPAVLKILEGGPDGKAQVC